VPGSYRSEDLADALADRVAGKRVLLARADRGRNVLQDRLTPVAANVRQVTVYTNADIEKWPAEIEMALRDDRVDWVTLTSSAIARRFAALDRSIRSDVRSKRVKYASISPVTSESAREAGITPTVEAREFTMAGLVQAIVDYERAGN